MKQDAKRMVFYDTGGGDIYAGRNKKEVVSAMLKDCPDLPIKDVFRVSAHTLLQFNHTWTLAEEVALNYTNNFPCCIASSNG